eukprot:5496631-Pleurochrysis_carterae.AAC.3
MLLEASTLVDAAVVDVSSQRRLYMYGEAIVDACAGPEWSCVWPECGWDEFTYRFCLLSWRNGSGYAGCSWKESLLCQYQYKLLCTQSSTSPTLIRDGYRVNMVAAGLKLNHPGSRPAGPPEAATLRSAPPTSGVVNM